MNFLKIIVVMTLVLNLYKNALATETLSLQQAVDQALSSNYQLKVLAQQIEVVQGFVSQVESYPNPQLNSSLEEMPSLKGNSGEVNILWQQPMVLSGRVAKNISLAKTQLSIAQQNYTLGKLRLKKQVSQLYYQAFIQQVYLEQTRLLLQTIQEMETFIYKQQTAGKVSLTALNTIRLLRGKIKLEVLQTDTKRKENLTNLSQLWGSTTLQFQYLSEPLPKQKITLSDGSGWREAIDHHPEILLQKSKIIQASKQLEFQQSKTWPDIKMNLGFRYFPLQNDIGLLSGFNWPLPITNANQGNIRSAKEMMKQEEIKQDMLNLSLKSRLKKSLLSYRQAILSLETYQKEILPLAKENLRIATLSYKSGKLPYLSVLDAQRNLYQLQKEWASNLEKYYLVLTDLEYISGHSLRGRF